MIAAPFNRFAGFYLCFFLLVLAGCMPKTQEYYVFDIGNLSKEAWAKISKECEYEARKATAAARPGDARANEREQLYILCLEAKGYRYKGKTVEAVP